LPVAFCDGTVNTSTKCHKKFEEIEKVVKNENEGGPFGTSMRKLTELLRKVETHSKLSIFDRDRIQEALKNFD
jgi:hypothetical protein